MASRNIQEYFKINRLIPSNKRASIKSPVEPYSTSKVVNSIKTTAQPPPKPTLKRLRDFLSTSWVKWVIDAFYHRRYDYPKVIVRGAPIIESSEGPGAPIIIGLAADWANDTDQSEYVVDRMKEKGHHDSVLDYTIHLGDTYYSGKLEEINSCFGKGNGDTGLWPRGAKGSFLLAGNHEMYSGGDAYYDIITDTKNKRELGINGAEHEPVFCLETDHWCILGLDTGYDCITHKFIVAATNNALQFPKTVITWLEDIIKLRMKNKGIIILSHHQYISAFGGESEFQGPAQQLQDVLGDKEVLWIWGHEHRFSMYGRYQQSPKHIAAYGRCIGNGGMPDEHKPTREVRTDMSHSRNATDRNLVLFDHRTADTFVVPRFPLGHQNLEVGYNGYAILTLLEEEATIEYYAAYRDSSRKTAENLLVTENWLVEGGKIKFVTAFDNSPGALTYPTNKKVTDVGG